MVSRINAIKMGLIGLAAGLVVAKGIELPNDGEVGKRDGEILRKEEEPLPYLPPTERINPEIPLPDDVIGSADLWRSYHTRIWSGEETKLFLRPGIAEMKIFRDLHDRKLKSLEVVMFDDVCDLNEEQRANMDPELVKAFDKSINDSRFGAGLFLLTENGSCGIFCRKYSTSDGDFDPHLLESHPDVDGDWVATHNTPAITFRHEAFHYDEYAFSANMQDTEAFVGMDIVESIQEAVAKLEQGDDSGYCVVYEIKEGVMVS